MSIRPKFRIFSYGTLRQSNVQVALYGREVPTVEDTLPGWKLDWIQITDPEVILASGSDRHPILRKGKPTDSVSGAYLELDQTELAATDKYEVSDYKRQSVTLASGLQAFVYVADESVTWKQILRLAGGFSALLAGFICLIPLPEIGVPIVLFGTRLLGDRYKWARTLNAKVDSGWARIKAWFKKRFRG